MFTIATVTELLGWSLVINLGFLAAVTLMLLSMRDTMIKLHGKMFGLDTEDLSRAYFQYIAQYKIAVFIFNLVPYLALRIMG